MRVYVAVQQRFKHQQRAMWMVSQRIGKQRQLKAGSVQQQLEKLPASVRAKVEHVFFYMKRMFGYSKVCYTIYTSLAKNTNRTIHACWTYKSCAQLQVFAATTWLVRPKHWKFSKNA